MEIDVAYEQWTTIEPRQDNLRQSKLHQEVSRRMPQAKWLVKPTLKVPFHVVWETENNKNINKINYNNSNFCIQL